ncbi:MAG: MFS transporter, partial [Eubacterium sp.]
ITPVIGGFIADRWLSPRRLVPLGELLMAAGYFCASAAHGKGMIILMIALIAIGTGFFKGNVSGIQGRQFPAADAEFLDTVFSWQYSFVNIGSFCGTTFLVLIATSTKFGYRGMFFACGIFMVIDCIWWLIGQRSLGDAGLKPFLVDNRTEDAEKADVAEEKTALTSVEKNRVTAILLVTLLSGIFWLVWYMAYLPVYYKFGPTAQGGLGWANWNIGSFTMPTSWFDSANGLLCIIFCPIFAKIWSSLDKKGKDWSFLTKTGFGIFVLGACVAVLALAGIMSGEGKSSVGVWVIFLSALFMTLGEVVFSPLGNSFISKYAPKSLLGTLLGVWPLIIFFAGLIYGPLYNFMDKFDFVKAYGLLAIIILVIGILLMPFGKKFNKWIHADEL